MSSSSAMAIWTDRDDRRRRPRRQDRILRDYPTTYLSRRHVTITVGFDVMSVLRDGKPERFTREELSNRCGCGLAAPTPVRPAAVVAARRAAVAVAARDGDSMPY